MELQRGEPKVRVSGSSPLLIMWWLQKRGQPSAAPRDVRNAGNAVDRPDTQAEWSRCVADAANAAPWIRADLVGASWLRGWDLAIREREVIATVRCHHSDVSGVVCPQRFLPARSGDT